MATQISTTLFPDQSTDAHLQAWATFIESTLVTVGGWTHSTETGETAPGSLVHTASVNTKVGFRVYKMADTLQGTNPVFMRIDFGSGPVAGDPSIWVTIGTGSDGAGNISGVVWNAGQINTGSSSGSQANNSYGSADTNRASIALFIQSANQNFPLIFTIERTKDATGADTGDGLLICYAAGSVVLGRSRYLILAGGTQPTEENGLSYVLTRQNPSETFGSDVGCGILIHFKGVAQQPGTNVMIVNSNDVSAEGTFTMTLYSATRTYKQLNAISAQKALSGSSVTDTNARCGIRYD